MSRDENYNLKRYMHPNFIVALFKIAKTWRQPNYSLTDEWIFKILDVYKICIIIYIYSFHGSQPYYLEEA